MRKPYILLTSICILFAFFLPSSLAKTHEGGTEVTQPALVEALQASAPEPVAYVTTIEPKTPTAPQNTSCGDNVYASYIYMHESGCRTDAINPIGACGLGQALPCSKMSCGLSDYTCQNQWFTNYAVSKYGSWYGAYLFWLGNAWW